MSYVVQYSKIPPIHSFPDSVAIETNALHVYYKSA